MWDFTTKPRHSHAVITLWVYIPTHLPLSHPFHLHHIKSMLTENQSPKHITEITHHKLFDTYMLQHLKLHDADYVDIGS